MSDRFVEAEAEQVHQCKGADQRCRQGQGADERGAQVAQEQKDHAYHQRDGQQERELHFMDGAVDVIGTVIEQSHGGVAGCLAGEFRQLFAHRAETSTVLAPGWRFTARTMAGRSA